MMKDPIHVIVCTNAHYLPGAFVTLGSLLDANGGRDSFRLHILDTGIGDQGRVALSRFLQRYLNAEVVFHSVVDATFFRDCPTDYGGGFSAYSRLFLGSLIDASRCIYVDVDILVLKDVATLWHRSMDGKILLAVRDYQGSYLSTLNDDCPFLPAEEAKKYPYYCTGVLLCDLAAWRAFDTERKAFELIRQAPQTLRAWDQTILNYLLRGHIGEIDKSWALYCVIEPFLGNANYHFFSKKKPWGQRIFIPANTLWHTYYRLRVRPFYRYQQPFRIRLFNFCWSIRSFLFAFILTEPYIRFRRWMGKREDAVQATRIMLKAYRQNVLHGLDPQSRATLETLRRYWGQCKP